MTCRPVYWLVLALLLALPGIVLAAVQPITVRLTYLGDTAAPAYLGVQQGLDEANRQGLFSGQLYLLKAVSEVSAIADTQPDAVMVGVSQPEALRAVSELLPGVPVFNLSIDEDEARSACANNLFHVGPSMKMKADAEAQFQKSQPGSNAVAVAWHPDFAKYAARQLNNRFVETRGRTMDDDAWAGWAAMKLWSDSVARLKSKDPAKVLDYLKTQLVFDGQKGVNMNFRANGQLRQVLLLVDDGKIVGEAPVRGVVEIEDLDSLGSVACE